MPDFEEENEEEFDVNDGLQEDEVHGDGDSDGEEVPKTIFEDVPDKHILDNNSVRKSDVQSEDPFGIYEVLNKNRDGKNNEGKPEDSLKYPPGFTPNEDGDESVVRADILSEESRLRDGKENGGFAGIPVQERMEVSNDNHESTCSGHFKKSKVPRTGGSIIQLIDDLVNVGQTMGYDMTGCINNMADIIESQGVNEVHR
ncbi:hypothetical protein Tco_0992132 [Tanacetum coccineum]|uniref:RNA-directed DNA polymerase, eukaryota n=1 Tax=Tanacetum coccineum TaxID=301880 RepID=A0ABQ5F210_9ASTR